MVKYYYEKRDPAWCWLDSIYHKKRVDNRRCHYVSNWIYRCYPFCSIVINEAAQQELDPTTQRPEPIFFGIISPFYSEIVFMTIGVVGFSLLVLGGSMHQEEESKQQQQ